MASGVTTWLPLAGVGGNNLIFAEGVQVPMTQRPVADDRGVSPGFFRAMGMRVVAGRVFDNGDRSRPVVLVSAQTGAVYGRTARIPSGEGCGSAVTINHGSK